MKTYTVDCLVVKSKCFMLATIPVEDLSKDIQNELQENTGDFVEYLKHRNLSDFDGLKIINDAMILNINVVLRVSVINDYYDPYNEYEIDAGVMYEFAKTEILNQARLIGIKPIQLVFPEL